MSAIYKWCHCFPPYHMPSATQDTCPHIPSPTALQSTSRHPRLLPEAPGGCLSYMTIHPSTQRRGKLTRKTDILRTSGRTSWLQAWLNSKISSLSGEGDWFPSGKSFGKERLFPGLCSAVWWKGIDWWLLGDDLFWLSSLLVRNSFPVHMIMHWAPFDRPSPELLEIWFLGSL